MMESPVALDGGWIRCLDRLVVSDTEQFCPLPLDLIPILKNRLGTYNNRLAHIGCELFLLLDTNAADDGTIERNVLATPAAPGGPNIAAQEALPASPWLFTETGWSIDWVNHKLRRKPSASIGVAGQNGVLIAPQTYNTSFRVSDVAGGGSFTLRLGTTAGAARSTNGVFAEQIISDDVDFTFLPSASVSGAIDDVTIYPDTLPGDVQVNLYTVRNCVIAHRSTQPFRSLVFDTSALPVVRETLWVDWKEACSGFAIGFVLPAAYTAGKLFASAWFRRHAWGAGH